MNKWRPARLALAAVMCAAIFAPFMAAGSAHAQSETDADAGTQVEAETESDIAPFAIDPNAGVADILQVSGLLDPLLADFIINTLEAADDPRVRVAILQVNSTGSVVDQELLNQVAQAIQDAPVPVTMWVGPSNARALGPWVEIAALVDRVAVAPGARIGESGARQLDPNFDVDWGPAANAMTNDTIGSDRALELGVASFEAPSVGEFMIGLQDLGIEAGILETDEGPRLVPTTQPRFQRLSLMAGQLHTAASPPVAYLLFAIGLALFVFEFYTAGVGVAGVVGAGMFVLGCFGLYILPTSLVAVVLLCLSMFAFSVDVQTGVPRFWTIVGAIALVIGTVTLYTDGVSMSWIPMLVGVVGITMMMVTGMPTMVRTRFSTPTIGREWMIGQLGVAAEAIAPEGSVSIDEALWKARTNRATPLVAGDRVRVVAVEGLVLEVEPEEGGARDYRERRPRSEPDMSAEEQP